MNCSTFAGPIKIWLALFLLTVELQTGDSEGVSGQGNLARSSKSA